jgi:hypothetical protein
MLELLKRIAWLWLLLTTKVLLLIEAVEIGLQYRCNPIEKCEPTGRWGPRILPWALPVARSDQSCGVCGFCCGHNPTGSVRSSGLLPTYE